MLRSSFLFGVVWLVTMGMALPTEPDTFVVAGEKQVQPPQSTNKTLPIEITEMFVYSEISLRYAHTAIVTRVRNQASTSQNATFHVLLPNTAFISGFVMTINDVSYKAYIKEKKEAQKIYDQAVSQGKSAAQVATARDSNQFTVSVNVEPHTTVVFNLTCEELLKRINGVYNHAINLNPGTVVPNLSVYVHIQESEDIKLLRVPELRTGNEIAANKTDPQNSNAVIQLCGKEASISFKPDEKEQIKLSKVYEEKRKETQQGESSHNGNLGQFVVQYDVERPKDGEILVNDGYFVYFLGRDNLPPLYKHIIFVLDTSGSMMGRKIQQLIEAMNLILDQLRPLDYFSIVEFSTSVIVHDLKEANSNVTVLPGSQRKPPVLVPPYIANKQNIKAAHTIIDRLKATSSTNIYESLMTAIELVNKGIGWTPEGGPAKTSEELEPIIIFLTDGLPNVITSDTKKIVKDVTEKNHENHVSTIFSLGFGLGADMKFLRVLSLTNGGFARHIYEASDSALQLIDFFKEISSPLLVNVKFSYPPDQIVNGSVTKHEFRTYYLGSEIVVAGRVAEGKELTPEVYADSAVDDGSYERRDFKIIPIRKPYRRTEYLPLERIWAYLTIQQLLDEIDANNNKTEAEKRALALALQYSFVTPLTSLVVVKPNSTNAVDPSAGDQSRPGGMVPGGGFANGGAIMSKSIVRRPQSTPSRQPPQSGKDNKQDNKQSDPLSKYRLSEFPWVKDILKPNEDALEVTHDDGTTIDLKLSTNVVNDPSDGGECLEDVSDGGPGVCTYLVRCDAAKTITAQEYNSKYCDLKGFAGVCCPKV